jgi:hypothetical protein
MVSIQTAWITSANAGQPPAFTVFASPNAMLEAGGQVFYLTNNLAAFEELLPERRHAMIDIMVLRAYAFSEAPLERAEQLFAEGVTPTAEGLWNVWTQIENRLITFPLWALETIELLLRDLNEKPLAKLFGDIAHRVRHTGVSCGHWTEAFKSARNSLDTKIVRLFRLSASPRI